MPMTQSFKERLFPLLPQISHDFRTSIVGDTGEFFGDKELHWALSSGFHIYDALGIRQTIRLMQELFFTKHPGNNFFAVKACPNIEILKIILSMGFGLDCASPTELYRAKLAGAQPDQIMYTSNNTNPAFYPYALASGGILNLDDISFLEKVPELPKRICFRYNPGDLRQEGTDKIIGAPVNQKYGVRHDQIVEAYKRARDLGAEIFGIHTMYASNCRDPHILAGNAKMQLGEIDKVQDALGIPFDFFNIGGGLGIVYNPQEQQELDIHLMSQLVNEQLDEFKARRGYLPKLYIESGRYVTGPHGVIVSKAINVMDKYKKFVGIDICDASDILRAPIYPAHHEVSILTPSGVEKVDGPKEVVSIVGPLCENMHMVSDRELPIIDEGDYVVVEDTGAHGIAMSMKYNGFGCSQELLLEEDNTVSRISRAETIGDLLAREKDAIHMSMKY